MATGSTASDNVSDNEAVPRASSGTKRHSPVFLFVFAVFLIATMICAVGALLAIAHGQLKHHDTRWFWASGQLLVRRRNPYDQDAVRRVQAAVGIADDSNCVVRNPPLALFSTVVLGYLGPRAATYVWSLLLAACLTVSTLAMRANLEGLSGRRVDSGYLLLMCFFAPALACVASGQTGVVLLLGLTLFLLFGGSRPVWAGAALSLCAFKPHLFLPFGLVLLAWIVARRRWALAWAAVAALAIESAIAMFFDPAVWTQYVVAMRAQGIERLHVPTLGVALRFALDPTAMWIEFVPAILGCAWGLWYFSRNAETWDWRTHGSLLTLVSLLVAPYSWSTDNVIVLPAILFALLGAHPPRRGSLTLLLVAMSLTAIEFIEAPVFYFRPNLLLGVMWLLWYLYATSGRAADKTNTLAAVLV